jgi:hypothetical protein
MGLLDIFRKNNKKKPEEKKTDNMVFVSEIVNEIPSDNEPIVAQSQVPEFITIGNLISEKKYSIAIEEGLKQLKRNPNAAGIHINLMVAYFKARDISSDYLDKSSYHAKMAILNGHHTGYAENRLAKNLDKQKKYHQVVQLCNLVLRNDYHFSTHGCGNHIDFSTRKEKTLQKISKASDKECDVLFTTEEINSIIKDFKATEERNVKLQMERSALEKEITIAMRKAKITNNYTDVDKLMTRFRNISNQIAW